MIVLPAPGSSASRKRSGVRGSISPYTAGTVFPGFQSGPGQGASSPITILFSSPIERVSVKIHDPTYAGNMLEGFDDDGLIGSIGFVFTGQPGNNVPDTKELVGVMTRVVLTPAPADYVTYEVSITPDGRPTLVLECTPNPVTRGADVTCNVRLSNNQKFTFFSGEITAPTVGAPPSFFTGQSMQGGKSWATTGPALFSTTVEVSVTPNGGVPGEVSGSIQLAVQARTTFPALSFPAPPPPARTGARTLLHEMRQVRPAPRGRTAFSLRAALAMGIPVLAGWLAGDTSAGLMATLGGFTALYCGDRPYAARAIALALIAAAFASAVMFGLWLEPHGWAVLPVLAMVAMLATWLCNAMRVGPPGAYLFVLACATGTAMPAGHLPPWQAGLLVLSGGAVAWVLHTVGALWQLRGPERRAVAAAARTLYPAEDPVDGMAQAPAHSGQPLGAPTQRVSNGFVGHDCILLCRGSARPMHPPESPASALSLGRSVLEPPA